MYCMNGGEYVIVSFPGCTYWSNACVLRQYAGTLNNSIVCSEE